MNDGACIYTPLSSNRCNDGDRNTPSGDCSKKNILTESACTSLGSSYKWRVRAKTEASCTGSDKFCDLPYYGRTRMNSTTCSSCDGKVRSVYQWTQPQWKNSTTLPLSWLPIEWAPENKWMNTTDFSKVNSIFQAAAGRVIGREIILDFNSKFSLFANTFKYVACDCAQGGSNCFSGGLVSTPLASCTLDPSVSGGCSSGAVNVPAGAFGNTTIPTVNVDFVSAASYVASGNSTSGIVKRATGNSATYSVVTYGGALVGQVVGSGISATFSSVPGAFINICLNSDVNIDQDTSSFPVVDFANGTLTTLTPLRLNVTKTGSTYCADVSPFLNAVLFPIIRIAAYDTVDTVTVNQGATATTTSPANRPISTKVSSGRMPAPLSITVLIGIILSLL